MALVATQGLWMPGIETTLINIGAFTNQTIDATGEKVALMGRVWNKERATKNITKVGFPFGTVTKAGGSGLTLSLQNISTASGPPYQPDGTQDQTVAIANGDATFASNTWHQTAALSATRSVAFGEALAVVIEYDGSGRLGADSVVIRTLNQGSIAINRGMTGGTALFTASWASAMGYPACVLEFDDGTFGNLGYGVPVSAFGSISYDTGTATDENALKFQVPFECKCDGAYFIVQTAAVGCDFDIVLYEGTTAIASASVDYNSTVQLSADATLIVSWDEVTLSAGTDYYLSIKPTTTNDVNIPYMDVANASHFQAWPGGTAWHYAARADAGAWSATTTRRPFAGIRLSAVHDGTGAGGGLIRHPGMAGGLNG